MHLYIFFNYLFCFCATRSVTKNETVTKKDVNIQPAATTTTTTTTTTNTDPVKPPKKPVPPPIKHNVKPKMCLRSFRGRFIHHELKFKAAAAVAATAAKKKAAVAATASTAAGSSKVVVKKQQKKVEEVVKKKKEEPSSDFSSDDDEPLVKTVESGATVKGRGVVGKGVKKGGKKAIEVVR